MSKTLLFGPRILSVVIFEFLSRSSIMLSDSINHLLDDCLLMSKIPCLKKYNTDLKISVKILINGEVYSLLSKKKVMTMRKIDNGKLLR